MTEVAGTREKRQTQLEERVRRSREELIARGNVLLSSLRSTFDVMAPVRRNPVGGVAAAVSTGMLLSGLWSFFGGRRAGRTDGIAAHPTRSSAVTSLLWRFLPAVGPAILDYIKNRSGEKLEARQRLATSLTRPRS